MLGSIYPKYIKITSVSKPTYAEVNFAEEGGGGNETDSKTESDFSAVLADGTETPMPLQYVVDFENFNATDIVNFQFTVDGSTHDFTCYKIPFPSNYFPNDGANMIGIYLGYNCLEDGRVESAHIQVAEYEGQNLMIIDLTL
jgi:hypothetical protein